MRVNLTKIVAPLQGANTFLLHIIPQGVALGCGLAPLQGAQTTLKGSNSKARGGTLVVLHMLSFGIPSMLNDFVGILPSQLNEEVIPVDGLL
jgi:hypothetical protein